MQTCESRGKGQEKERKRRKKRKEERTENNCIYNLYIV